MLSKRKKTLKMCVALIQWLQFTSEGTFFFASFFLIRNIYYLSVYLFVFQTQPLFGFVRWIPHCISTTNIPLSYFTFCSFLSIVQTIGGNTRGKPCAFPFVYRGRTYYTCTKKNEKRYWCATTSNFDKHKKWAYCKGLYKLQRSCNCTYR